MARLYINNLHRIDFSPYRGDDNAQQCQQCERKADGEGLMALAHLLVRHLRLVEETDVEHLRAEFNQIHVVAEVVHAVGEEFCIVVETFGVDVVAGGVETSPWVEVVADDVTVGDENLFGFGTAAQVVELLDGVELDGQASFLL